MKTITGKQLTQGMIVAITHVPGLWGKLTGGNRALRGTPMEVIAIDLPFVVFETMERNESQTPDILSLVTGGRMQKTSGACDIVKHRKICDTRGLRFKRLSSTFTEEARRGCQQEITESGGEPSPFAEKD